MSARFLRLVPASKWIVNAGPEPSVAKAYHALAAHCVADDRKRLEGDLVFGDSVIRAFDVALVDLGLRDEAIDVDRMAAFDCDGVEFFVLDLKIDPFLNLVASPFVLPLRRKPW